MYYLIIILLHPLISPNITAANIAQNEIRVINKEIISSKNESNQLIQKEEDRKIENDSDPLGEFKIKPNENKKNKNQDAKTNWPVP